MEIPIGVNLRKNARFFLVGASFARDPSADVASTARSYSRELGEQSFPTTRGYVLKLTAMVRWKTEPTKNVHIFKILL